MDNKEALFIRACKSNSQLFRIKRLYKKIYRSSYEEAHVVNILSKIIDSYGLISLNRFLVEYAEPAKYWQFGGTQEDSHNMIMIKATSSIIRLTEVVKFPNLPTPCKFKGKGV